MDSTLLHYEGILLGAELLLTYQRLSSRMPMIQILMFRYSQTLRSRIMGI